MTDKQTPEIVQLTDELQKLQNQTAQLQQAAKALKDGQNELVRNEQEQKRILSQIELVTHEYQKALAQQNKSLADTKANQVKMLKEVELFKAENAVNKKRLEIQVFETRQQLAEKQRFQQLVTTFYSLSKAILFVSLLESYFDKYIWLNYFNTGLGVKDLNPNELISLSDRLEASKIKDDLNQKIAESQQLLTPSDKEDIGKAAVLTSQIPDDELKLSKMKQVLIEEDEKLTTLRRKLERIEAMKGYPPDKLKTLNYTGFALLAVSIFGIIFLASSNTVTSTVKDIFFVIGIGMLIAGIITLWIRYNNDKPNRLADTTKKLGILNSQHLQSGTITQTLQAKILQNKNELENVYGRHPVLKIVG